MTVALIVLALFALLLLGLPISSVLLIMGTALLMIGDMSPALVPIGLLSSLDSFVIVAVPLFLLMSNVLLRGGVGKDLFAAVQVWVGHWPGGLAVATVVSCAIFAAISGSSVATAATIGTVAIPEMLERGYPRKFVLGLIAAGGTLGILIPPSIILIIFGAITEESVLKLFAGGLFPGLLIAGLFVVYSIAHSFIVRDASKVVRTPLKDRIAPTLRAMPTALLAGLVILTIYLGWATPTEASAIGFVGALFLTGVVLRSLSWQELLLAMRQAMITTCALALIVACAKVFGKSISLWQIPQQMSELIVLNVDTAGGFILVVASVLLIMGLFMETLSMMLIMVPVLIGAVVALGVDVIWFGIFFVIMIECALITPPVGLNLFVIQAVGKATMKEVSFGVLPFLLLMLFAVFLLTIFDQIVLWLPSVI